MKIILSILLILTTNLSVNAMCSSSGISVWPSQKNIAANSIFVIEGYSQSQELIRQLNKKNKIYLTCNSEIIPIKVLRILEGQHSLTQAILKPEKQLTIGKIYELHIDNLGMFDKNAYKVVKWTVSTNNDNIMPEWNCEPTYKGKSYTAYGCGPAIYVNFCGSFKDNSSTLIYAKVYNKTNKTSSDYFLTTDNQKISLGHGMCSGEFSFEEKIDYEVEFGLMDASGNENKVLTDPISFTGPTMDENTEKEFNCNCDKNNTYIWLYVLITFVIIGLGLLIYKKPTKSKRK